MPIIKASVKWGKEKYDGIELNTDDSPLTFKAQVFALSGVAPDRQKIMFKGKTLSDDSNFATFLGSGNWKDGLQFLMMGSAEALPSAPAVKPKFIEDMSEGQFARAMELPPGLKNLGNTCYMNATFQCLKNVPELKEALTRFRGDVVAPGAALQPPQAVTAALRDLFSSMDRTTKDEVVPIVMLQVLHTVFPQFADKDDHGHLRQQDANELWVEVIRMLQQKLPDSFVAKYFTGRFDTTITCKDPDASNEPPTQSAEDFLQLSCFLSQDVKYIQSGLKAKMTEEITKLSPTLNRDAKYERRYAISRLPAYLTVQMVRFFYKEKDQVNAKILKDVKFPMVLDVYDMCSIELQKKLSPMRIRVKEEDDKVLEKKKKEKLSEDGKSVPVVGTAEKKRTALPYAFEDDPGSNNSGFYELRAVLTHKGRSSNSGHYVAWVKRKPNEWLMCDDDVIRPVDDEEVLKLSGGGDWHCAYVLLYGPKIVEVDAEETGINDKVVPMETSQSAQQ